MSGDSEDIRDARAQFGLAAIQLTNKVLCMHVLECLFMVIYNFWYKDSDKSVNNFI